MSAYIGSLVVTMAAVAATIAAYMAYRAEREAAAASKRAIELASKARQLASEASRLASLATERVSESRASRFAFSSSSDTSSCNSLDTATPNAKLRGAEPIGEASRSNDVLGDGRLGKD